MGGAKCAAGIRPSCYVIPEVFTNDKVRTKNIV